MINIINKRSDKPYEILYKNYHEAILSQQKSVEAICISSFNNKTGEVNSRFVNLKFIDDDKFIFFSNYNSTKANEFFGHKHIAACFFWNSINVQIRIKAKIDKCSSEYNNLYFNQRNSYKNALAISSNQSTKINSFNMVKEKYKIALESKDLSACPAYWGGYFFKPYEIEFWEGGEHRLNKRDLYVNYKKDWNHSILEP